MGEGLARSRWISSMHRCWQEVSAKGRAVVIRSSKRPVARERPSGKARARGAHQPEGQLAGDELVAGESAPGGTWGLEIGRVGRPMHGSDRPVPARPLLRLQEVGRQPLGQVRRPRHGGSQQRAQPPLPQALHQPVDRQHSLLGLAWVEQLGVGDLPLLAEPVELAVDEDGGTDREAGGQVVAAGAEEHELHGLARGVGAQPVRCAAAGRGQAVPLDHGTQRHHLSLVGAAQRRARGRVDRRDRQVGQELEATRVGPVEQPGRGCGHGRAHPRQRGQCREQRIEQLRAQLAGL